MLIPVGEPLHEPVKHMLKACQMHCTKKSGLAAKLEMAVQVIYLTYA
jgi:hypothetical protein